MIIAIANQKGGTGKTTTAITLAHGFSRKGFNVLLVDLDPQGNVADSLGLEKEPGLYRLLVDRVPLSEVVRSSEREGLDVLLGDERTARVEAALMEMSFGEFVLKRALEKGKGAYDYVILDCPPSLGIFLNTAFVAAEGIVIPTRLAWLSLVGVVEEHRENSPLGGDVEVLGILPTFFERVTKESRAQLRELVQCYGSLVLPPIPKDTKLREAAAYGETIWEYDPRSRAVAGIEIGGERTGGYGEVLGILIEKIGGLGWAQKVKGTGRGASRRP